MSEPTRMANDWTGADSDEQWDLCVYVTDSSPKCQRAIENLRRACEEHLAGRYHDRGRGRAQEPAPGRR
jgi:circadian clock protein KaiB